MTDGADRPRRNLDLAVSVAALVLGAPGCAGLALGVPLAEWPIPLHPQMDGEIALKTVVYLSGFLAAYGAIGIVWRFLGAAADGGDAGRDPDAPEGPASLAEPLYGFLPAAAQRGLARETGYQPLLFTKISIIVSTAIGVLLAGSWDVVSVTEPIAPDAALRIGAGLYLMAESFRRYRCFARGEPSGTLAGTLVHGALLPLRGRKGGA